jgi:hypothetical protein
MRQVQWRLDRTWSHTWAVATPPPPLTRRALLLLTIQLLLLQREFTSTSNYIFGTMADSKKTVLIVGGGAVGTLAAVNLEVGGLAQVTVVLRSNYNVVKDKGYTIESCDHGNLSGWRPSVGTFAGRITQAISLASNITKFATPSPTSSKKAYRHTTMSSSAPKTFPTFHLQLSILSPRHFPRIAARPSSCSSRMASTSKSLSCAHTQTSLFSPVSP